MCIIMINSTTVIKFCFLNQNKNKNKMDKFVKINAFCAYKMHPLSLYTPTTVGVIDHCGHYQFQETPFVHATES